ncbi:cohesin domain-containing protein [Ruminococcus sp.]|uniref:cohesin domain-containing protein n=2 Tax=Ruminococcus sp. TaxID=41978 RepID=UPI003AB28ACF
MNKKLLAIVIAIVTLMSFSVVGIYAITQEESNPTFYLESVKAKKDNNVSIKVFIKNNPGLWGINVKINYDKTALTLIDVENGDFFKESEWTKGDLEILSYEANGLEDITTVNGTLAILNFKVNNDAVPGKYDVSISYNAGDCINVSFEDVNFDVINGIIEVEQETLPTIEPTVSEPVTTEPITVEPTEEPTTEPITVEPTEEPTTEPITVEPTEEPTTEPITVEPTEEPTTEPVTVKPTVESTTVSVTVESTIEPTTKVVSTSEATTLEPKLNESKLNQNTNLISTKDENNNINDKVNTDNGIVKTGNISMNIIVLLVIVSLFVIIFFAYKKVR